MGQKNKDFEEVMFKLDPFSCYIYPLIKNDEDRQFIIGGLLKKSAKHQKDWRMFLEKLLKPEQADTFFNVLKDDKRLQLMYLRSIPEVAEVFLDQPHLLDRIVFSLPAPLLTYNSKSARKKPEKRLRVIKDYCELLSKNNMHETLESRLIIRSALRSEILTGNPKEVLDILKRKKSESDCRLFATEVDLLEEDYRAWSSLKFITVEGEPLLNQNFMNTGRSFEPYLYQRMDIYNFLKHNGWNIFYPTGMGKTAVPLVATAMYWEKLAKESLPYHKRALVLGVPTARETWLEAIVGKKNLEGRVDISTRVLNKDYSFGFITCNFSNDAEEFKDLFLASNFFFVSHQNLMRKLYPRTGRKKRLVDLIMELGYDVLIQDEFELSKSPRRNSFYARNAVQLSRMKTLYDNKKYVPVSVLTANPLADKVEDVCVLWAMKDKKNSIETAKKELKSGGIEKAFYVLHNIGSFLPEKIARQEQMLLEHIIPIKPSRNVYELSKQILLERRKRDFNWITLLRYLYVNPFMLDDTVLSKFGLTRKNFDIDDMRKALALIDIFTSPSPEINPLERNEKTIIFSPYFRDGVLTRNKTIGKYYNNDYPTVYELLNDALAKHYGDSQQIISIHGKIDDNCCSSKLSAREKLFLMFEKSPVHNILFITSETGGTSRDLSIANNIILLDPAIAVYVDNQQKGRCLRPRQKKPVNVFYLIMQDPNKERSRIKHKDKKLNLEQICALPYSNYNFIITSPLPTMSLDEATLALNKTKELILRYGMTGIMSNLAENFREIFSGRKQQLAVLKPYKISSLDEDLESYNFDPNDTLQIIAEAMKPYFIALRRVNYIPRKSTQNEQLFTPPYAVAYFLRGIEKLQHIRPVTRNYVARLLFKMLEPVKKDNEKLFLKSDIDYLIKSEYLKAGYLSLDKARELLLRESCLPNNDVCITKESLDLLIQGIDRVLLPDNTVLYRSEDIKKIIEPLKTKQGAEFLRQKENLNPSGMNLPQTKTRKLKLKSDNEKSKYGYINKKILQDILGGADTMEEFMKRKIDNIPKFMENKEYHSVEDVIRHVFEKKGAEILYSDLKLILDDYSLKKESPVGVLKTEKFYNITKVAGYLRNTGYDKLSWESLENVWYMLNHEKNKINKKALGNPRKALKKILPYEKKFPDPPEKFKRGLHNVVDMLLSLKGEYVVGIKTGVTQLIEISVNKAIKYFEESDKLVPTCLYSKIHEILGSYLNISNPESS